MYGLAIGTKDAKDASVGVSWVGEATNPDSEFEIGMGAATGAPLACGVKFMCEGRINASGVFSPEAGIVDPKEFLSEFFDQLGILGKLPSTDLMDNIKISYS
jgi:saccharopine dehydrogenase-like NADP-dependent oxidoreductase